MFSESVDPWPMDPRAYTYANVGGLQAQDPFEDAFDQLPDLVVWDEEQKPPAMLNYYILLYICVCYYLRLSIPAK